MKKLLFVLLLALPILLTAQTKKSKRTSKKSSKEVRYYYDSLGAKRNWDSMINVVITQTMDTMKVKGYLKDK